MKYDISIVIPVYNSSDYLEKLVDRLFKVFSNNEKTFEIVFIDDNSKDNSWEVLNSLFKKNDNITIIQLTRNFSEHNAVTAGLNNCQGEYVIIMDDDGQNPPEELPKIIKVADDSDCDVVYTYYETKKHSLFRNLGSWFANFCANQVINKPKDLYLSSFKLIKRVIVDKIIEYKGPYTYIDGLIFYFTDKVKTVKVDHSYREFGKSNYNFKKLISLWLNIALNFSIVPLRFSFIIGFVILLISCGYTVSTIIEKIVLGSDIPWGITSIIVLISLGLSLNFILIGILGEYIGRVFLNISNKPQFAIRHKYQNK